MADITAANAQFSITIANLLPAPTLLQGYSTDDAFTTEAADIAEVVKGVDGRMSAAITPYTVDMTVNFQADSPSCSIFDLIYNSMTVATLVYFINGTVVLPSLGKKFTLQNGVLRSWVPIPTARKQGLQSQPARITWDKIFSQSV